MTATGEQLAFDLSHPVEVAVHCVFCRWVVRDGSPQGAHDAMENHYATSHRPQVLALVGAMRS